MAPELDTLLETVTAHAHALNAEAAALADEKVKLGDGFHFDFLLHTIRTEEIPAAREEIAKLRRVKFGEDPTPGATLAKFVLHRPPVERVVKWVLNDTVCVGCGHAAREHTGNHETRDGCDYTGCECPYFEGSISAQRACS